MPQASEQAQTQGAAPDVLTEEMVADFDKNPHKIAEAPREIRQALRDRIGKPPADDAAGDSGAPDPAGEKPAAPETPAEPMGEPAKEEGQKPESVEEKRARLRAMDNEANTIEQRIAAAQRRLAKAKEKEDEFKKANPDTKPADYLEESHQAGLHSKVTELEALVHSLRSQVQERDQEEIETLTRSKATTAENKISAEIDMLMEDPKFTAARMKKSFAQANAEYAGWLDNLVQLSGLNQDTLSDEEKANPVQALRAKALAKYEEDPTFKSTVKVSPPEEMDKLSFWLEAYGRKGKHGGTIKGHLFEILDEAGVLEEGFQRGQHNAARTAANKTVDAIRKQDEEITTIAPTDGASRPAGTDNELTPQSAAAFMAVVRKKQDAREKLTDAERKQLIRVREFIATGR